MTRNQYYDMTENFVKYAGRDVEYKAWNIYYGRVKGMKKYNVKTAQLIGVGIEGNTYHFILQLPYGGRTAVHYSHIKFPSC